MRVKKFTGVRALVLLSLLTACTRVGTPPPVTLGRPLAPTVEPVGVVTFTLYFPRWFDDETLGLQAVERRLLPGETAARTSLEALIHGPDGDERATNLHYPLHFRTRVAYVEVTEGVAAAELAEDPLFRVRGRPFSELAYWSLVYTLTALPGIERVTLLKDGKPLPTFGEPPIPIHPAATRQDAPDWVRPRVP